MFEGESSPSHDEELSIQGRQVIWSSGQAVKKSYTFQSNVLQATWCSFHDTTSAVLTINSLTSGSTGSNDNNAKEENIQHTPTGQNLANLSTNSGDFSNSVTYSQGLDEAQVFVT